MRGLWGIPGLLATRQALKLPAPHTHAELAVLVGLDAGYLSSLIHGHTACTPDVAERLVRILAVDLWQLRPPYPQKGGTNANSILRQLRDTSGNH